MDKGAFLRPPPTDDAPQWIQSTLKGLTRSAPPGPRVFRWTVTVGFIPQGGTTHVVPLRGTQDESSDKYEDE